MQLIPIFPIRATFFCVTGGVLISIPSLASYTRWCALIGKMGINAIYSTVFLIGAELFPTPIRSKAISFGMAICTVGGFISPLVIEGIGFLTSRETVELGFSVRYHHFVNHEKLNK